LLLLIPYVDIMRSEASVLAKKAEYDDCVRRAASTEPIAMPPIRPISTTRPDSRSGDART
jgi:hypothetical protein